MKIVIDTHALFWLLTNDKRLKSRAKTMVREAAQIFVPTIVLLELLYTLNKKRLAGHFPSILDSLKSDIKFTIISLDVGVVESSIDFSTKLEMHDCIILTTAKMLDIPVVTKDRAIRKTYRRAIW